MIKKFISGLEIHIRNNYVLFLFFYRVNNPLSTVRAPNAGMDGKRAKKTGLDFAPAVEMVTFATLCPPMSTFGWGFGLVSF